MVDVYFLDINLEDVDKVEVFRGVVGVVVFGVQGGNGVIQIFMKNGYELVDG